MNLFNASSVYYFKFRDEKDLMYFDRFLGLNNPESGSKIFPLEQDGILSFEVEEEEFKVPNIRLNVTDNLGLFTRTFRRGVKARLNFGQDISKQNILTGSILDDPDVITGDFSRGGSQGMKMYVSDIPQGSIDNGVHSLTLNFRANILNSDVPKSEVYSKTKYPTISSIIQYIAVTELNIPLTNVILTIPSGNDNLAKNASYSQTVRNNQKPISFIRDLCIKNNLKFVYNLEENPFIIITDFENEINTQKKVISRYKNKGVYHVFDYGNNGANIIKMDYSLVPSSFGSIAVPVQGADGKINMEFKGASQQTDRTYRLNAEAVKQYAKQQASNSSLRLSAGQIAKIMELDFEDVFDANGNPKNEYKPFFTLETVSTAPENGGIEVSLDVIPNPIYRVGDIAFLGNPDNSKYSIIPSFLRSNKSNLRASYYRIAKLVWSHSSSGVTQKVILKG